MRLGKDEYKGLHQRYAALMGDITLAEDENEDSSAPDTASIENLFVLLMSWLYQQRNFTPEMLTAEEVQRFINAHTDYLNKAVETALAEVPLDEISIQRLKESNYVFSGIKTFHELNEAFPSLIDSEGKLIPFNQFLNSVQTINKSYNGQYLKVEYEFAKSSSYMAARWKEFEKDGEDYYLQYRTAGDARVRRTHQRLHGITLPITSKFWDKYFPPNGWNCRCTVVQVRKGKYPLSDETQAMNLGSQATAGKHQEMFMYNPGKKMTTFPAYNAYTISRCKECPYSGGSIKLAKVPDNELCRACRILREATKGNAGKIRRMAKPLQGKKIVRDELPQPILISGASLREWTNQPHKHYFAKNSMLLDIEKILTEAVYLGKVENHKEKELKKGVKLSHIFECEVAGDKSWIIAREYKWGEIILHSISDNFEEVVKGIKKG